MGKFYLENKHTWFRHQAKRSHMRNMHEGRGLAGTLAQLNDLRFYLHDESSRSPKGGVRISEHGLGPLAVLQGNAYIGVLDEESSIAMRTYLKEINEQDCPAVIIKREEWSGGYLIRLGLQ
jgi:hypothetical protein